MGCRVGAGCRRRGESGHGVGALGEGVGQGVGVAGQPCGWACAEGLGEGVELVLAVCFPHLDALGLFVH